MLSADSPLEIRGLIMAASTEVNAVKLADKGATGMEGRVLLRTTFLFLKYVVTSFRFLTVLSSRGAP